MLPFIQGPDLFYLVPCTVAALPDRVLSAIGISGVFLLFLPLSTKTPNNTLLA